MCGTVSWNLAFLMALLEFPESGCVRKGMTHQTLLPEEKDNRDFRNTGAGQTRQKKIFYAGHSAV